MRKYFESFLTEYDVPTEGHEALLAAYDTLAKEKEFLEAVYIYYEKHDNFREVLQTICERVNIPLFTAYAVFFICISKETKERCKKWNWTDDMFRRGMLDIKYHLEECITTRKIWGVVAPGWIAGIIGGVVVSLGRMQFVLKEYEGEDIKLGDYTFTKGMKYLSSHIPGSGEPFDEKARIDAYDKAYEFFRDDFGDAPCVFGCTSWLLFPPNRQMLRPDSNIIAFMNEFKIVDEIIFEEDEIRRDIWRIYGYLPDDLDFNDLPEKTSVQRGYKKWLVDGNLPGLGVGFFVYDYENKKTIN